MPKKICMLLDCRNTPIPLDNTYTHTPTQKYSDIPSRAFPYTEMWYIIVNYKHKTRAQYNITAPMSVKEILQEVLGVAQKALGDHQLTFTTALKKIIEIRDRPSEEPSDGIAAPQTGLVGHNRLHDVLRYTPRRIIILLIKNNHGRLVDMVEKGLPDGGRFSENQHKIIKSVIVAALPTIVTTSEYTVHRADYLRIVDWSGPDKRFTAIKAPRQIGKTLTVSACVFCIMASCPGATIGLYALKSGQVCISFSFKLNHSPSKACIMLERVEDFFHQFGLMVTSNRTTKVVPPFFIQLNKIQDSKIRPRRWKPVNTQSIFHEQLGTSIY